MTDYAPLHMLRRSLEPHHVAQIVNEAPEVYRNCIIDEVKNSRLTTEMYCHISDKFQNPFKTIKAVGFESKFEIVELLVEKYEGIFVDQTLLIRKIFQ
jgi:hypothetical protein